MGLLNAQIFVSFSSRNQQTVVLNQSAFSQIVKEGVTGCWNPRKASPNSRALLHPMQRREGLSAVTVYFGAGVLYGLAG